MKKEFSHEGTMFRVSSYSRKGVGLCVGIAIEPDGVTAINTNHPELGTLQFSHLEWDAFIKGVKNSEFDI